MIHLQENSDFHWHTKKKTILTACTVNWLAPMTLQFCAVRMHNAIFLVVNIFLLSEQQQVKCITVLKL